MVRLISESVEELFGGTPIVRIKSTPNRGSAAIYAKLDYFNPGKSVKDRIAFSMVYDAQKRGRLKKGYALIEPTSGNTGISLALAGRVHGYRVIIVMPESTNGTIGNMLAKMGAEVKLSPVEKGMNGAREMAARLCRKNTNYFMPDQFNNPANPAVHRRVTAQEIIDAMGDKKVDAFVAGVGTGGTITGVGETLKARYPKIKIVAVEPAESPVLSGGAPGTHYINGIGAGFIPPLLNMEIIDEVITVSSEKAEKEADALTKKESLFAGISSGAVYYAAKRVAARMKKNQTVVAFFADARAGV